MASLDVHCRVRVGDWGHVMRWLSPRGLEIDRVVAKSAPVAGFHLKSGYSQQLSSRDQLSRHRLKINSHEIMRHDERQHGYAGGETSVVKNLYTGVLPIWLTVCGVKEPNPQRTGVEVDGVMKAVLFRRRRVDH